MPARLCWRDPGRLAGGEGRATLSTSFAAENARSRISFACLEETDHGRARNPHQRARRSWAAQIERLEFPSSMRIAICALVQRRMFESSSIANISPAGNKSTSPFEALPAGCVRTNETFSASGRRGKLKTNRAHRFHSSKRCPLDVAVSPLENPPHFLQEFFIAYPGFLHALL